MCSVQSVQFSSGANTLRASRTGSTKTNKVTNPQFAGILPAAGMQIVELPRTLLAVQKNGAPAACALRMVHRKTSASPACAQSRASAGGAAFWHYVVVVVHWGAKIFALREFLGLNDPDVARVSDEESVPGSN